MLALYFILAVVAVICAALARPALPDNAEAGWLPIAAFLTWRVSRGGRVSRVILILANGLSFVGTAHIGPSSWSPIVLALLAIYAAQIALLVSPAVYQRTRPVSFSTLYLLWLPGRRSRQVPEQPSAAEQPAAV